MVWYGRSSRSEVWGLRHGRETGVSLSAKPAERKYENIAGIKVETTKFIPNCCKIAHLNLPLVSCRDVWSIMCMSQRLFPDGLRSKFFRTKRNRCSKRISNVVTPCLYITFASIIYVTTFFFEPAFVPMCTVSCLSKSFPRSDDMKKLKKWRFPATERIVFFFSLSCNFMVASLAEVTETVVRFCFF